MLCSFTNRVLAQVDVEEVEGNRGLQERCFPLAGKLHVFSVW